MDKDILTPHEVAIYLRLSQQTILKMLRRHELKGMKVTQRGDWKVKKQDMLEYIEKNIV